VLSGFRDVLDERRAAGAAAGSFTCYDVTTACGVVHAAEAADVPVILLVSEASVASRDGRLLLPALGAVARSARVPVCVQFDHASSLGLIGEALASGAVGAVLADGSRLPYEDNVAFASAARELAGRHGAEIEVELGHVEGGEDVAAATAAGKLTDPTAAADFVAATGASCLAVSIGNVHGTYSAAPALDWTRLDAIRAAVDVPLSLHGASGLPQGDLRRAVAAGVAKVNVNTEVRERIFAMLDSRLDELSRGWRIAELDAAIVAVVEEVVGEKLELLGRSER
jgi:tagatose 1,6-diphosphate aldolase GatY/KbaY